MNTDFEQLLEKLSTFLNNNPKAITQNQVSKVMKTGAEKKDAVRALIREYFDYDAYLDRYYEDIIQVQNAEEYKENDYYKNMKLPNKKFAGWEIRTGRFDPYELFVYDDFKEVNGVVVPRIGYFEKPFPYLEVMQNGRQWMSVTPNEINTMKNPVDLAHGNVVTFGLGLGYFTYMVSNKEEVESVTVVESDPKIITLFNTLILPQFQHKEKIRVINQDAYQVLKKMKDGDFDYLFIDIYHDASDGMECYKKARKYTDKFIKTEAEYWIFDTIKQYL